MGLGVSPTYGGTPECKRLFISSALLLPIRSALRRWTIQRWKSTQQRTVRTNLRYSSVWAKSWRFSPWVEGSPPRRVIVHTTRWKVYYTTKIEKCARSACSRPTPYLPSNLVAPARDAGSEDRSFSSPIVWGQYSRLGIYCQVPLWAILIYTCQI